jgi:diketogulonate reductase-like aldo/keto reductase
MSCQAHIRDFFLLISTPLIILLGLSFVTLHQSQIAFATQTKKPANNKINFNAFLVFIEVIKFGKDSKIFLIADILVE